MPRQPLTILLILIIGLQTFSRWVVLLDFEVNKNIIAAKLCVNRSMPGSCCKGKCYLNKQLAKDGNQQQPLNNSQKDLVYFFSEALSGWAFSHAGPADINQHPYCCGKSQDYFFSVFQPPQV